MSTPISVINTHYQAILRITPSSALATTLAAQIDAGSLTLAGMDAQLLTQAQFSTIPALTMYDVMFGTTPTSGGLDFLTHFATTLQAQGFSLQNVYVNLGANFITLSPLAATYAAQDRATFLVNAYNNVFGHAPTPDAENYLLSQFDFYKNYTGSELGAKGAIYGILMSISNVQPTTLFTIPNDKYYIPAQTFLQDAVAGTAPYGQELINTLGSGLNQSFSLTDNVGHNINEGSAIVFTLAAVNIPPGTMVNYTITGPGAGQVLIPLNGQLKVDDTGHATLTAATSANVFDGSTPTFTVSIVNTFASDTVTIHNAGTGITDNVGGVMSEGGSVTFTLTSSAVAGTQFAYTLTGAAASQVVGPTHGTLTVDGTGHATLLVNTLANNFNGGSLPLTIQLDNTPTAHDTVQVNENAAAVFVLTTGTDNFTGVTNQANTFKGDLTEFDFNGIGPTLGPNDVVTGGAGVSNTFIITDAFGAANDIIPTGFQGSNLQHIILDTAGNAGQLLETNAGGDNAFDTTGISGVTDVTINSTGAFVDFSKSGAGVEVTDNQNNVMGGVFVTGGHDVLVNSNGAEGIQVGDGTAGNDPTGAVVVNWTYADQIPDVDENHEDDEFGVRVLGGTDVTVNVTSPLNDDHVQVGNSRPAATAADPSGNVNINDAGTGSISEWGGHNVTVFSGGGYVSIGDPSGVGVDPTGAINVQDQAASAFNSLGDHAIASNGGPTAAAIIGRGFIDDPGEADVHIAGGTTVTVNTNAGAVFIGTATSVTGTNPTGNVLVHDIATDSDGLREEENGNEGNGGGDEGNTTVTGGERFALSRSAGLEDDQVGHEADVLVFGGTNVTVFGNANIIIGSNAFFDSTDNKADPTGAINATETSSTTFYTEGQFHEDGFVVAVNGGTSTTITAHGQDVYAGTNSGVGGPVVITQQALLTGDGWGMNNGNVVVLGGTTVTVNTTGGSVLIGGVDFLGDFKAPTGAVNVTNTYAGGNGPDDENVTVLGGTTVNITTTATRGDINVGASDQWWLEFPNQLTPLLLDTTGTQLANPHLYPTGNVTIVNASQYGAPNFWAFGKEDTNVFTNGATTVSIVGGEIGTIADAQSALATGGPNIGKAIGASTIANVILDGVRTDFWGGQPGGFIGAYIQSDALVNLSVFDVFENHDATFTIIDNAPNQSLNLTVGNVSSVNINDPTALSMTISTGVGVLGQPLPPNDEHGLVPDPNELFLNANSATSLTFLNNAWLSLSHEAPEVYLDAVTTITAKNTAELDLGNWADNINLTLVDASKAAGPLSIEIDPGITSVKGLGGLSDETITIDQNTVAGFVQGGGAGTNSTIVANYIAGPVITSGKFINQETDVDLGSTFNVKGFDNLGIGRNALSMNLDANGVYKLGSTYYSASGFTGGVFVGEVSGDVAILDAAQGLALHITDSPGRGNVITFISDNPGTTPMPIFIGVDGNQETGTHDVYAHVSLGNADGDGSFPSLINTVNITSMGWTGGDEENNLWLGDSVAKTITINGDQSIDLHLKTDDLNDLDTVEFGTAYDKATGGPTKATPGDSQVSKIDASGFTGVGQDVDVNHVDVAFTGATFIGGAGHFDATGEQLFFTQLPIPGLFPLVPGDHGGTVGNDMFTTGSGGGTYVFGAGGAWDLGSPGSGFPDYGTGSETVILTASKAVIDTLVVNVDNGPYSVFNGVKGGVTDFQVLPSGPSDVLDFTTTIDPPYGATTQLFNTKGPITVGSLSDIGSASFTLEPATVIDFITTMNDINYTSSNGVITFTWNSQIPTAQDLIDAAEVIVNDSQNYFKDTGNGTNGVFGTGDPQALVAEFVFNGNTYVVSSDPNNSLANNSFITVTGFITGTATQLNSVSATVTVTVDITTSATEWSANNHTSVIELVGVTGVTGFGNTPAVGAVETNPSTHEDLTRDSVFNLTGSADNNFGKFIDAPLNYLTSVAPGASRSLDYTGFSVATFDVAGTLFDNHDLTTFKNLAPSAVLVIHNDQSGAPPNPTGSFLGNLATTQTGASGSNSLTIALDPYFTTSFVVTASGHPTSYQHTDNDITLDVVRVSGDNLVLFDVDIGTDINTLQDATNTLVNINVTDVMIRSQPHAFDLGGVTSTALKSIDVTGFDSGNLTIGDANPLAQNGLTITGHDTDYNVTLYASGGKDVITFGDANHVFVDATGPQATIAFEDVRNNEKLPVALDTGSGPLLDGSAYSEIQANGGGASISVGEGNWDIDAHGTGNTVTFSEHASDQSYVSVGANSTVNLGEGNEEVVVTGDVVGAGGSASPAMTTINNIKTDDGFVIKFDNAVNEGVNQDFTNGSGDFGMWQGVVNVTGGGGPNGTGATTLAQALDIAATHAHGLGNQLGGAIFGEGDLPGQQNGDISWFVWGGNTYIVEAMNNAAHAQDHVGLAANDVVVKLTGVIDLSGSTFDSSGHLHV